MLAVLDELVDAPVEFVAVVPESGPLAEQLRLRSIQIVPFSLRDSEGQKYEPEELTAKLRAVVVDHGVDILHSNSLSMARLTGRHRDGLPAVLRCTGHLRDIIRLSRAAMNDINRNDGLIAVSSATKDFHTHQGLDAALCSVIHNGIDAIRFFGSGSAANRQVVLPEIPADARVLLNVGQICLRKNQLVLAKAVVRLLQHRDDLQLVLVGDRHSTKAESVAFEHAVFEEFRRSGKSHHLHMTGFRQDIADLMIAADLLVHTSEQEPFGRTLLEAASCGLPIVATEVGGTAEMLRAEIDALLIPPGDVDALCQAIEVSIDEFEASAVRSQTARNRIVAEFDVRTTAERTHEFWQRQFAGGEGAGV